jgi:hypothetical protein
MIATPVIAYPSLSQAARLLGVPKSTLAQRKPPSRPAGNRKHIPAATVVHLALYFHRRDIDAVIHDLVDIARQTAGPSAAEQVEAEAKAAQRSHSARRYGTSHQTQERLLDRMRGEYDRLVRQMQSPGYARRMRDAFADMTPEEMGHAAVFQAGMAGIAKTGRAKDQQRDGLLT